MRCVRSARVFLYEVAADAVPRGPLLPACPKCAGVLKSGTVLFGETLPERAFSPPDAWTRDADAALSWGAAASSTLWRRCPSLALDRGARLAS